MSEWDEFDEISAAMSHYHEMATQMAQTMRIQASVNDRPVGVKHNDVIYVDAGVVANLVVALWEKMQNNEPVDNGGVYVYLNTALAEAMRSVGEEVEGGF